MPWREGTRTRAAHRHELLQVLISKRSLADLKAELELNRSASSKTGSKTIFREKAFEKAMSDGTINSLDADLREKINAAYIAIGHSNRTVDAAIRMPPLQDHYPGFSDQQAQEAVKQAAPPIEIAYQALNKVSI